MASLPSSNPFRFIASDGTPIAGPTEWTPCLVALDLTVEEWTSLRLTLQDQPIALSLQKHLDGTVRITGVWPRSGAGHYRLALIGTGTAATEVVRVSPSKLSDESFRRMLDQLETELPASVAITLQRGGAL